MSLIRPSIGGSLLKASRPVVRGSIPTLKRYDSQTSSGTPTEANKPQPIYRTRESLVTKHEAAHYQNVQYTEPDYTVMTDPATSRFTPTPNRIMNGSEDGEVLPAAVLSGAPIELQARIVRIYCPSKPATQSGNWHGHHWRMDWDILSKGHRWENPLIGWQSSADFMQGTHINFKSKEDAIEFAKKQGYEYFVQEPAPRKIVPKAYANNFLHTFKPLKHIRTK